MAANPARQSRQLRRIGGKMVPAANFLAGKPIDLVGLFNQHLIHPDLLSVVSPGRIQETVSFLHSLANRMRLPSICAPMRNRTPYSSCPETYAGKHDSPGRHPSSISPPTVKADSSDAGNTTA